jgi:hypothetical protein
MVGTSETSYVSEFAIVHNMHKRSSLKLFNSHSLTDILRRCWKRNSNIEPTPFESRHVSNRFTPLLHEILPVGRYGKDSFYAVKHFL